MSEQQTGKCPACGSFLLGCTLAEHQAGYCPRILLSGKPTPPATPQPLCPFCGVVEPCRVHVVAPAGLPATPQPETLLDVPHAEVDALVEAIYAERRAFSPPPDVERLTREAFRAGFLAVCRKKSDDTPLDMLTRVWTFDGVAAADLESEAYAAWRALSPSTPGEPT